MTLHSRTPDPETLRRRRAALAAMCPTWTIVLPSAPRAPRLPTIDHPYASDANLYYLTGYEQDDATLVLRPGAEPILYAPAPDATHARWLGARPELDAVAARAGLADVRPTTQLDGDLDAHLAAGETIGHRLGVHPRLDARIIDALHRIRTRRRGNVLRTIADPRGPLGRLRLRKDDGELARLRAAAALTVQAHRALLSSTLAGETGLALAGRFEARCREGGAERMSYETIVARGEEATCLHPHPTRVPLREGELVLVDAGAELDRYACDVTRTWPVGRFSEVQAAAYDAVLDAQRAVLSAVRTGTTIDALHDLAKSRLFEGLARLGLRPEPSAAPDAPFVERYFPHGTSHLLGLDVHDAGALVEDDAPIPIEAGMVFTVEPGLYFDLDDATVPHALRGIGIRIEDTVVVTPEGVEVLTEGVPKARSELEALRAQAG
jgi:Xaa-Pro aminopeptidase